LVYIFYGHLVWYFMDIVAISYNLWSFGIFFPVLVFSTEKNLATLTGALHREQSCQMVCFQPKKSRLGEFL
jgi:hypothetical protein